MAEAEADFVGKNFQLRSDQAEWLREQAYLQGPGVSQAQIVRAAIDAAIAKTTKPKTRR